MKITNPSLTDNTQTGDTLPMRDRNWPAGTLVAGNFGGRFFAIAPADVRHIQRTPGSEVWCGRELPDGTVELFSHLCQF